ncbi:MAG: anion permease, partial [Bacteroidetes bacterium]|nr:anion permease [Bacteroidota bacterium]
MMVVINFLKEKKGLIIASLAALIILLLPQPAPVEFGGNTIILTIEGQRIIALLVGLIIIFITEAIPIGAVIGLIYAWIAFFGILTPKDTAGIFSQDAVWFLIGSLMIAQVLVKYGIHKRVLLFIIKIMGSKARYISLGIISFCAISAAFIAEHTIAAMMLPVALVLISRNGGFKNAPNLSKLFLFSIAFGCIIGGLGTPSGGGRNVLMLGFLEEFYDVRVGYGAWMIMALPIVIVLIPCVWILLISQFKPERNDLANTVKEMEK